MVAESFQFPSEALSTLFMYDAWQQPIISSPYCRVFDLQSESEFLLFSSATKWNTPPNQDILFQTLVQLRRPRVQNPRCCQQHSVTCRYVLLLDLQCPFQWLVRLLLMGMLLCSWTWNTPKCVGCRLLLQQHIVFSYHPLHCSESVMKNKLSTRTPASNGTRYQQLPFTPSTSDQPSAVLFHLWAVSLSGSHVKFPEVVSPGCRLVFARPTQRWCNVVSQCVGASDLWPSCLSMELQFDCFIHCKALESMLMS